jgi:aspartate ammonia-lyase
LLKNLFTGLLINEEAGYKAVINNPSVTTALNPHIGYHKAGELASLMKKEKIDVFEANSRLKLIDESKLQSILEPGNLLKLGFSLDDL